MFSIIFRMSHEQQRISIQSRSRMVPEAIMENIAGLMSQTAEYSLNLLEIGNVTTGDDWTKRISSRNNIHVEQKILKTQKLLKRCYCIVKR